MSDFVLSPFVHTTMTKGLFRNSASSFLLEQVGEVGSKSSMNPVEALDGSMGFLIPKDNAEVEPCSSKVGLGVTDKSCPFGLPKLLGQPKSKRLPSLDGSAGGLAKVGPRSFSSAFEGVLYPLTNEEKGGNNERGGFFNDPILQERS